MVGFWYNLYHAVLDIDGDSITAGWDTDLDGTIDTATTNASGFTLVYVPIENFHTLDNEYDSDVSIATVAFIAQDEHGLGSVMFVDVIGSDDYLNDDDDGGLMLYVFSGTDAPDRTQMTVQPTRALLLELRPKAATLAGHLSPLRQASTVQHLE